MATKREVFIKLLKQAGDKGLTVSSALRSVNTTNMGIYSIVHDLRRKGVQIEFDMQGNTYVYRGETPGIPQIIQKVKYKRSHKKKTGKDVAPSTSFAADSNILSAREVHPSAHKNTTAMKGLVRKAKDLATEDRNDFYDMLTKSIFYQMSAKAIVEANELVDDLRKEVSSEA